MSTASPQSRVVETTFRVRFAETDQMGIVHHAAYLVYFEEGRSELGRQFGASCAALAAAGYSLAVTELNVRYVGAARYDEAITVRTWVERLQSRGIAYCYEVTRTASGEILATGSSKHVCLDQSGKVRRFPPTWASTLRCAAGLRGQL